MDKRFLLLFFKKEGLTYYLFPLTAQLCALERRTGRSGRDSIDHPTGAHDDVANAAAGVMVMAGGGLPPMQISAEALAVARSRARPGMGWH